MQHGWQIEVDNLELVSTVSPGCTDTWLSNRLNEKALVTIAVLQASPSSSYLLLRTICIVVQLDGHKWEERGILFHMSERLMFFSKYWPFWQKWSLSLHLHMKINKLRKTTARSQQCYWHWQNFYFIVQGSGGLGGAKSDRYRMTLKDTTFIIYKSKAG